MITYENMNTKKNNLLINKHPELLSEWDYEKNANANIDLNTITCGSNRKIWWKCSQHGHSFEASVKNRVNGGTGCPFCASQKVLKGFNDLQSCYPDLVNNEWDWTENDKSGLKPDEITKYSNRKASWYCTVCKGKYEATVSKKTISKQGCPYCAGKKVLLGFNDLLTLCPELIESSWDLVENNKKGLKPDAITPGSNMKANWHCTTCKGKYDMIIYDKTSGIGCPYCAGRKVLRGFNDLASQYPELVASEWDWVENSKKGLKPDAITKCSNIKANWHCNTCNGKYEMIVNKKTTDNQGCPYCAGKKALHGFNDLETLYPDISKEWYQPMNGNVTPRMVTKGAHTIRIPDPVNPNRTLTVKPAWKCSKYCHIWRASVNDRTSKNRGCPVCACRISKQENQVADFIKNYLCKHHANMHYTMHRSIKFNKIYKNLHINAENVLSDSLQKHLLKEIDIYIPELNLAVEYDGDYWHNDKIMLAQRGLTNSESHAIKQSLCKQAGIKLIFITEHDWLNDNERMKQAIINVINTQSLKTDKELT